jgi:hypothetical protein
MSSDGSYPPRCTICGKRATHASIDGEWWPPCEHARTHGIATLRYDDEGPESRPTRPEEGTAQ